MIILGLHFGHDGAVAVAIDGEVKTVLLSERIARAKHVVGIDREMIERALATCGLTVADVDFCAATTTQTVPIILSSRDGLDVTFAPQDGGTIPSPLLTATGGAIWLSEETYKFRYGKWLDGRPTNDAARRLALYRDDAGAMRMIAPPENIVVPPSWRHRGDLAGIAHLDVAAQFAAKDERLLFHHPMSLTLGGARVPGIFVDHHAAHAADSYYQSGLGSAAVLTYDGASEARQAGLLFVARDNFIVPVARPNIWLGWFYNMVADRVGLGHDAGKLMGLAPYGAPALFDPAFVGSSSDLGNTNVFAVGTKWIEGALAAARTRGYDLGPLGDRARILDRINVDLAAAAHRTFEDNVVALLANLSRALAASDFAVEGLCMAGGCALSCPTNSRVAASADWRRVFIQPSCDDSGLAGGAALWLHHNVLGRPLLPRDPDEPVSPYLGAPTPTAAVDTALVAARTADVTVEPLGPGAPARAGADLAADKVIGWFEGRSEIGPRALGHRSLLADPRQAANWPRVNRIKGREAWRPFAPAVLREDAPTWFGNMPVSSPYMLFTGDVIDRAALPAITHVDGTARVQTVSPATGGYRSVLEAFRRDTGCPVVLNTSLNGPGEPIVEAPDEAVRFFLRGGFDVLYVDGHRLTRREG